MLISHRCPRVRCAPVSTPPEWAGEADGTWRRRCAATASGRRQPGDGRGGKNHSTGHIESKVEYGKVLHYDLVCSACGRSMEGDGLVLNCDYECRPALLQTAYVNKEPALCSGSDGPFCYPRWLPISRTCSSPGTLLDHCHVSSGRSHRNYRNITFRLSAAGPVPSPSMKPRCACLRGLGRNKENHLKLSPDAICRTRRGPLFVLLGY